MKFNKIIYSSLLLILLTGSSCNKWLELAPQDGITKQEFWKTKEDVRAAVTGLYTSLIDGGDNSIPQTIFLWGELRADMVVASPRIRSTEKDVIDVNILPSNPITKWTSFYRTINYCNIVIDNAPAVRTLDPTFTEAQLKASVGEALTIRALMYFYLVRTFRDVPFKLKATSKDSDIEEVGKTQASVILDQIVKDLIEAEAGLPEEYSTNVLTKGRITKLTANALLADVYLWLEQYDKALAASEKVTAYATANPAKLGIISTGSGWWQAVFGTGSSIETIFELAYTGAMDNPFGAFLWDDGRNRLLGSPNLTLSFFLPDATSTTADYRSGAFFNSSSFKVSKYGGANPTRANFQIYRYSDVLTIKAEALAYVGRGAEAIQIINDLRVARVAQKTTAPAILPDPANPSGISDYILNERSREFAFEGKRWFDLLRNARKSNNSGADILTNMVAQIVAPELQQSAVNKFKDTDSWYLPINETEIFADTKLVQNPFYTK